MLLFFQFVNAINAFVTDFYAAGVQTEISSLIPSDVTILPQHGNLSVAGI